MNTNHLEVENITKILLAVLVFCTSTSVTLLAMQAIDTQRAQNLAAVADAQRPGPSLTNEEQLMTLVLGSSQQQINLYKKFGDIQIVSTTTSGNTITNYGYIANARGQVNFLVQRITSSNAAGNYSDRWNVPTGSGFDINTATPLLAKATPLELIYSGAGGGNLRSRTGRDINLRLQGGLPLTTTAGQVEVLRALDTLRNDKEAKKLLNANTGFVLHDATQNLSSYGLLQNITENDLLFSAPGNLIEIIVPVNNQPVTEEEEKVAFALIGASSADVATYLKFGHLRKGVSTTTNYNIGSTWSEKLVTNKTGYLFIANQAGTQKRLVGNTFMTKTNYQTGEVLQVAEMWFLLTGQLSEDLFLVFTKDFSPNANPKAQYCPQWCMQYNPSPKPVTNLNVVFKVAVPIESLEVRLELMSAIRYIRTNKAVNDVMKPIQDFTLDSFVVNNTVTPATYTYEITGGGKTLKFVSPGVFQGYK